MVELERLSFYERQNEIVGEGSKFYDVILVGYW